MPRVLRGNECWDGPVYQHLPLALLPCPVNSDFKRVAFGVCAGARVGLGGSTTEADGSCVAIPAPHDGAYSVWRNSMNAFRLRAPPKRKSCGVRKGLNTAEHWQVWPSQQRRVPLPIVCAPNVSRYVRAPRHARCHIRSCAALWHPQYMIRMISEAGPGEPDSGTGSAVETHCRAAQLIRFRLRVRFWVRVARVRAAVDVY